MFNPIWLYLMALNPWSIGHNFHNLHVFSVRLDFIGTLGRGFNVYHNHAYSLSYPAVDALDKERFIKFSLYDHILALPLGLNPWPRSHKFHNIFGRLHEHLIHAFSISPTTVEVKKKISKCVLHFLCTAIHLKFFSYIHFDLSVQNLTS